MGGSQGALTPAVAARIIKELMQQGATKKDSQGYVDLIRKLELLSSDEGELHHILPRNCGWWDEFHNRGWNLVRIRWGFHIALHAYLFEVFPTNARLLSAVRATTLRRKVSRNEKHKARIIKLYESGLNCKQIGLLLKVSKASVRYSLVCWGVRRRSSSERKTLVDAAKYRTRIIKLYKEGKSCSDIGLTINSTGSTIARYLRLWGIKVRSSAEVNASLKKLNYRQSVIRLYKSGKTLSQIARRYHVTDTTICNWLDSWGIKRRTQSEAKAVANGRDAVDKDKFKTKVINLYNDGWNQREISEIFGVTMRTIGLWLRAWNITLRTATEAQRLRRKQTGNGRLSRAA